MAHSSTDLQGLCLEDAPSKPQAATRAWSLPFFPILTPTKQSLFSPCLAVSEPAAYHHQRRPSPATVEHFYSPLSSSYSFASSLLCRMPANFSQASSGLWKCSKFCLFQHLFSFPSIITGTPGINQAHGHLGRAFPNLPCSQARTCESSDQWGRCRNSAFSRRVLTGKEQAFPLLPFFLFAEIWMWWLEFQQPSCTRAGSHTLRMVEQPERRNLNLWHVRKKHIYTILFKPWSFVVFSHLQLNRTATTFW